MMYFYFVKNKGNRMNTLRNGFYTKEEYIKLRTKPIYIKELKNIHDKSFGTHLTDKDVITWDIQNQII